MNKKIIIIFGIILIIVTILFLKKSNVLEKFQNPIPDVAQTEINRQRNNLPLQSGCSNFYRTVNLNENNVKLDGDEVGNAGNESKKDWTNNFTKITSTALRYNTQNELDFLEKRNNSLNNENSEGKTNKSLGEILSEVKNRSEIKSFCFYGDTDGTNSRTVLFKIIPSSYKEITPASQEITNSTECLNQAKKIYNGLYGTSQVPIDKIRANQPIVVGNFSHIPKNCSVQTGGDMAVHFNNHSTGNSTSTHSKQYYTPLYNVERIINYDRIEENQLSNPNLNLDPSLSIETNVSEDCERTTMTQEELLNNSADKIAKNISVMNDSIDSIANRLDCENKSDSRNNMKYSYKYLMDQNCKDTPEGCLFDDDSLKDQASTHGLREKPSCKITSQKIKAKKPFDYGMNILPNYESYDMMVPRSINGCLLNKDAGLSLEQCEKACFDNSGCTHFSHTSKDFTYDLNQNSHTTELRGDQCFYYSGEPDLMPIPMNNTGTVKTHILQNPKNKYNKIDSKSPSISDRARVIYATEDNTSLEECKRKCSYMPNCGYFIQTTVEANDVVLQNTPEVIANSPSDWPNLGPNQCVLFEGSIDTTLTNQNKFTNIYVKRPIASSSNTSRQYCRGEEREDRFQQKYRIYLLEVPNVMNPPRGSTWPENKDEILQHGGPALEKGGTVYARFQQPNTSDDIAVNDTNGPSITFRGIPPMYKENIDKRLMEQARKNMYVKAPADWNPTFTFVSGEPFATPYLSSQFRIYFLIFPQDNMNFVPPFGSEWPDNEEEIKTHGPTTNNITNAWARFENSNRSLNANKNATVSIDNRLMGQARRRVYIKARADWISPYSNDVGVWKGEPYQSENNGQS